MDSPQFENATLPSHKVEEFQLLLREAFGLELYPAEARRRARQLIALYRMLMGPIPEDPGVQTSAHLPSAPVDESVVLQ
jgi:hypothetical protein